MEDLSCRNDVSIVMMEDPAIKGWAYKNMASKIDWDMNYLSIELSEISGEKYGGKGTFLWIYYIFIF